MKKQHLIWFILGMGLLSALSSCTSVTAQGSPNSIVVKPALPKLIRTTSTVSTQETLDYVRQCVHDSYIIKSCTSGGAQTWIVVAEKY